MIAAAQEVLNDVWKRMKMEAGISEAEEQRKQSFLIEGGRTEIVEKTIYNSIFVWIVFQCYWAIFNIAIQTD